MSLPVSLMAQVCRTFRVAERILQFDQIRYAHLNLLRTPYEQVKGSVLDCSLLGMMGYCHL
jgi:hypothetical protein